MAFTTTELLEQIGRLAHVPISQNTFTNEGLLALADHVIRIKFLSTFLRVNESNFSCDKDYTISSTAIYRLPSRAIGGKIKDAKLIDSNGRSQSLDQAFEEQVTDPNSSPTGNNAFYFKENKVILVPAVPQAYTTLRLIYYRRPSKLVETTAARQITAIDTVTNVLTFASVPSTFTTSSPLDLIRQEQGFECLAIDQTPSAVTSTTVTLSSLPSDLAVGDWVALAGETPIPQMPVEFHELLAKEVAEIIHKSQGDIEGYKMEKEDNKELVPNSLTLLSPRITGERKVISSNAISRRRY